MFKPVDLALCFPAFAFTILLLLLCKPLAALAFSRRIKWSMTFFSVSLFAFTEAFSATGDGKQPLVESLKKRYSMSARLTPWVDYNTTGLVTYLVRAACQEVYYRIRSGELDEREREVVDAYWKQHESLNDYVRPDMKANEGKNLVYIVVESLNSWVVPVAMPYLDSMLDSVGTVYSLNMMPQVKSGVSSDGQMIYNTGMYPASDVTTVVLYGRNAFPGLPKVLKGYKAFEVISESSGMWNHSVTTKSYGYDFLIDNNRLQSRQENRGDDEVVFETALSVMDTIRQPFMAFLTTISMHGPYKDPNVACPAWIGNIKDKPENYRDYLSMSNYTDRCIRDFVDGLKRKGLYDNTVIVIVSDHSSGVEGVGRDDRIVFIAINTGVSLEVTRPIGQVDVYPTVLDILNVDAAYRGMGFSVFNTTVLDSLQPEPYPTANLMHRGNYYPPLSK